MLQAVTKTIKVIQLLESTDRRVLIYLCLKQSNVFWPTQTPL